MLPLLVRRSLLSRLVSLARPSSLTAPRRYAVAPSPAAAVDLAGVTGATVAEVSEYLYASRQHHRRLTAADDHTACRALEGQVWRVLQQLTDEEVEGAELNAACELLVSWNYFGRFWGRGMDGPSPSALGAAFACGGEGAGAAVEVPLLSREADDLVRERNAREDVMQPARRASPLDEVLDF